MINCGVYSLTTPDESLFYIGSAADVNQRFKRHMASLEKGNHHNPHLQRLWNAGVTFTLKKFRCDTREEAYRMEQVLLDCHYDDPGLLNICKDAIGGDTLTKNPRRLAIIKNITDTLRLRNAEMTTQERKARWSKPGALNGMFGKTHTPEVRAILRAVNVGRIPRRGFKLSEAQKRTLSDVAKLRTGERNHFYGKTHSVETRQKLREASLGRLPSNTEKVLIDGVLYPSLTEAGRKLGLHCTVVRHRTLSKNPKFANYQLVTKCPTTIESADWNENSVE